MGSMTTTDYLINALFILVVVRQAQERRLDRRAFVVPLVAVFFIAEQYVHSIPTAGNDLVLIAALTAVGLTLGTVCGFATQVRLGDDGFPVARIGWLAGTLLAAGICSRMAFAFAISHGARPEVRSFSIAHHIGATAWPVALVAMAVCEVVARLALVRVRANRCVVPGRPIVSLR
jgi:hypothetical protein